MGSFKIFVRTSAEQEFLAAPFPFRRQLKQRIARLKNDPRPPDCEHLSEAEKYRLAVRGWFILYEIEDKKQFVTIWAVLPA